MMAHYATWIAGLSGNTYFFLLLALSVAVLGLLGVGIFFIRRAYWISNTATSKIATAHQGYIELEGTANAEAGVYPLVSPLSGARCVWYEVSVEQDTRSDDTWLSQSWRQVYYQKSDHVLVVNDGSGECVVDPDSATVFPSRVRRWRGNTERPVPAGGMMARTYFGRYRYTEKLILDQDPIYVLGWFKTIRHDPQVAADDAVKSLLSDWKQDPLKMKSFDRDGNGEIDAEEWRAARAAARATVAQQQLQSMDETSQIHLMAQHAGSDRPFLISAWDQVSLAKRQRRWGYSAWGLSFVFFYLWVTAFYWRG